MNEMERLEMARDLSEMVRLGYLVAYLDEQGVMRFVPTMHATPKQIARNMLPGQVSRLIKASECE